LTTAIMDGTLPPGSQLGEAELASQLGISRGPLREALQRLVQQGIARSEPHRGVFVTSLDEEDVRDIYLARSAIETAACRLVLQHNPQRSAKRLAEAHRAMETAARRGDPTALSAADTRFHQILVDESGSVRLKRMAETLFVETRMCITALQDKYQTPDLMVDEHAAIIEALRDGDEGRLVSLLDAHMQDAVQRLINGDRQPADLAEPDTLTVLATGDRTA
jgi:DNA-binding GntR family transcriptional regulator